ncbi:hypothetical protein GJ496_001179 [Pomphorhynchus laevis]|nr:hypothetical protein GJ496_001179 [Pomphorhynchus laevis]
MGNLDRLSPRKAIDFLGDKAHEREELSHRFHNTIEALDFLIMTLDCGWRRSSSLKFCPLFPIKKIDRRRLSIRRIENTDDIQINHNAIYIFRSTS